MNDFGPFLCRGGQGENTDPAVVAGAFEAVLPSSLTAAAKTRH